MNCRKFEKYLDAYIAGTLTSSLKHAMTLHLDHCLSCCMLVKQEKELVAALGELKPEIQPAPALWMQLEKKIKSSGKQSAAVAAFSFITGSRTVAVVFLCVFLAGIILGALFFNPSAWFKLVNGEKMAGAVIVKEFNIAEIAYSQAKNRLLHSLEKSRPALDTGTIRVIEENLLLIDKAINETKTLIYNYPGDAQNMLRLADLYQDETRYILKTNSILTGIN